MLRYSIFTAGVVKANDSFQRLFTSATFPVKRQFRNARRRFETTNKKFLSAEYAQSNAEAFSIVLFPLHSVRFCDILPTAVLFCAVSSKSNLGF